MTRYLSAAGITVCVFVALFTSCAHRHDNPMDNACEILVVDYDGNTFDTESVFPQRDTLSLVPKDGVVLSEVVDLCVSPQHIYVLDANHSLSCYDRMSGEMLKYVRAIGHGTGEYIMPRAVCTKGDEVYLLYERACNVYDVGLNFKRKVSIDLIPLDFIKVDGGFLFCNLAPSENLKRLVYTDDDGNVIDSYLSSTLLIDAVMSTHCFFADEHSDVYFAEPSSDELYLWDGQGVELCYRSVIENSFEGKPQATSEKEGYAYNTKWFRLGNKVVNSFLYLGNRYYNVYDTTTRASVVGQVDVTENIPFAPYWQWNDCLFGAYHEDDASSGGERLVVTMFGL
ncbi:MAG: 6-bladed beta-propeller [Bacteroidaceae bacterium]|nr:6-bladed beta-propeller [Bacteroidaceae bacterium]